jgi:serine O-acetyltransferase
VGAREDLALDLARYRRFGLGTTFLGTLGLILTTEQLWVLVTYRICRWAMTDFRVPVLRHIVLVVAKTHLRFLRVLLNTWISPQAQIGGGLFINHFGGIWINPQARLGRFCNMHQGVTIGVGGRGRTNGVPQLGDRVNLMPHTVLLGNIRVGNDVMVGANSLVIADVPDHSVVIGLPARVISRQGSGIPMDPTRRPEEDPGLPEAQEEGPPAPQQTTGLRSV